MRLLGVVLIVAGAGLVVAGVAAPGPFLGLFVGLGLLLAGYLALDEGLDRAARRRRERERPGYVHRRP